MRHNSKHNSFTLTISMLCGVIIYLLFIKVTRNGEIKKILNARSTVSNKLNFVPKYLITVRTSYHTDKSLILLFGTTSQCIKNGFRKMMMYSFSVLLKNRQIFFHIFNSFCVYNINM